MRRTLRNHQEVAHFWANEVQAEGTSGNMFFEDKTIYSYGRHFAIAKHYFSNLVLFTNRDYSVSTSQHCSHVGSALPYDKEILYCNNPSWPADPENLSSAIREIEYNLKKAIKARQRKLDYMNTAESVYNQLIELKTTFKIKGWKIPKYDFSIPEEVMKTIKERERKAEATKKRKEAKQRKQDKLEYVEFLEDVELWKANKIASAYNVRHNRFAHREVYDVCRINGDNVESMRSASAPLKEVKIALKRIAQGKSVKGLSLGHYTVISYDGEALKIGCHMFHQVEIDSLIKQLNLN
jgi:hypothetical protein